MEQTNANSVRALTRADRDRIIAAIESHDVLVRGQDVPLLVEYVEEALNPVPANYRFLGMSAADVDDLLAGQDTLITNLCTLGAKAREILSSLPPQRGTAAFTDACRERLWLNRVDPLAAALIALLAGQRTGRESPRLASVRAALAALAGLAQFTPPPKRPGIKAQQSPGEGLVRAVCVYRHNQGLPVSMDWTKRHGEAATTASSSGGALIRVEWPPTTRTNELILIVADAFEIGVDSARLRTDLLHYSKELRAADRDRPDETDLYGNIFDFDRKKDVDTMLKARRSP